MASLSCCFHRSGHMAGRIVRVGGIPTDIPPESVADKLTIHFLRTRNGGGEIADIQITADCPGYALITFEEEEGNRARGQTSTKRHVGVRAKL